MDDLSIYILAGGKSSRMGQDKGLIDLLGKPMIKHLLESVSKLDLPVKIVAHHKGYKQFGFPVIKDIVPEKGPMGGLYTALSDSLSRFVLLLSCDMPFLSLEVIQDLIKQKKENQIVIAELHNNILPFPGIYPVNLLQVIHSHLQNDRLKFQQFILNTAHLKFNLDEEYQNHPEIFQNINSPQDREKAMTWGNKRIN
ncbi:molybdenum cofactor guanylyltransferase [Cecembia calidifontis]|uniref:Probable molybdenum cofactor guanylyltransferase n=1 Tax=Cecembia calidifontis TaxID=1187080 RepID=A0A4Q7PCI1_9BACT|nr:molybdenum cofactor guanylyltransferase [Cecembia calidifontis]RZS97925.1 molybdenum cofactor guanylyltransferase [Cecembia calidifontis]